MKRFLADLFAGRSSPDAILALLALYVICVVIFFIFVRVERTFWTVVGLLLLAALGSVIVPVAFWRLGIKRESDKIGAMGRAIILFMMGLFLLLQLIYYMQYGHF